MNLGICWRIIFFTIFSLSLLSHIELKFDIYKSFLLSFMCFNICWTFRYLCVIMGNFQTDTYQFLISFVSVQIMYWVSNLSYAFNKNIYLVSIFVVNYDKYVAYASYILYPFYIWNIFNISYFYIVYLILFLSILS